MRFIVPQNITLEDKVIGSLTIKQFFYLLGGAMIGFVMYTAVKPIAGQVTALLATLPTDFVAIAFAFLKINDQPFIVFVAALINYFLKPRARLWQRVPERIKLTTTAKKTEMPKKAKRVAGKGDLAQLAQLVDSRGWEAGQLDGRVTSANEQKQILKLS